MSDFLENTTDESLADPAVDTPPAPAPAPAIASAPTPAPDLSASLTGRQKVVAAVLTLLILLGGVGLFAGMMLLKRPPRRQAALATYTAVRVQAVALSDLQERLSGYGRARALRASDVAASVGGTVVWTSPKCEAGAWVGQDEPLIKLDPREWQAALDAATARTAQAGATLARAKVDRGSVAKRIAAAREELELATQEYERLAKLPDAVTRSQLDTQRFQVSLRRRGVLQLERESDSAGPMVDAASAEQKAARAAQARAQLDLDNTVVTAPFAGEIGERFVHEGQRVMPGAPLFHLTDTARMEVPVAIAARHFGEVRTGAALQLRRTTGGEPVWIGVVARIAPRIDDQDRTFFVYAEVLTDAPAGGGRVVPTVAPGAFLIGDIEGPLHGGVLAVPRSAFIGARAYVATPVSVVAFVASDDTPRTPEARAAQAAQLRGIAERLATLMQSVSGCGEVDPLVGSGVMKVVAAFQGTASWEAVSGRVREAVIAGSLLAPGITITVGVEAMVAERVPTVARRLPEQALIASGLAPGELLVVTNLEQVAAGSRVRLVGDAPELVRLPASSTPTEPQAAPAAGSAGGE